MAVLSGEAIVAVGPVEFVGERRASGGRRYVIPSPGTVEAKQIYEALGLPMPDVPHALD